MTDCRHSSNPSTSATGPRVLIVDDQALVRSGFRMILQAAGIDVAGEAADGQAAVDLAAELRPDVVLMDIRMPVLDGLRATERILAHNPQSRVIMLTTFDLDRYVFQALRLGASGFLLKDVTPEYLVTAVASVHAGDALLSPSVTRRLIETFADKPPADAGHKPDTHASSSASSSPIFAAGGRLAASSAGRVADTDDDPRPNLAELTARENEVLTMLGRGLSNAEIAGHLVLSPATVKTHVARIFSKLGLRDRAQAVVLAYEHGLVRPGAAR